MFEYIDPQGRIVNVHYYLPSSYASADPEDDLPVDR